MHYPALRTLPVLLAPVLFLSLSGPQEATADEITPEELAELVAGIQTQIEELRGLPFKHSVPASLIDHEGFVAFVKTELEEDTTPEELAAEETVAKLLGVIPPEMDLLGESLALLEEQVGGFYDPEKDEFFLMSTFTGGLAQIILAHELTHALDDQYQDLNAGIEARETNADARFAYQAVVEGSATVLMNQWTMAHLGELNPADLAASGNMGMEVMERTPPYVWKPMLGMYMKGAAFLNRTESVLKGNMGVPPLEDIQAAFADPPASSEQVLHPDKYWDPGRRDLPVVVGIDRTGLAAGWSVLAEDTLGEMGLAMAVEPLKKRKGLKGQLAVLGARYTVPAAEGWGGDRYVLLGKGEARVLLSVSVWDDAKEAKEFVAACEKLEEHMRGGARALAAQKELSASGHLRTYDADSGLVRLVTWFGATEEEVLALVEALPCAAGQLPR